MKNLRIFGTNLGSILELKTILGHLETGQLKSIVDSSFPLSEAGHAVQYLIDRKNKGKVILVP